VGFYLSKYSNTNFYGECLPKSNGVPPQTEVFVSNYLFSTREEANGEINYPFDSLMKSIERAFELAAPYF
jgi:hypothetical protein